MFWTFFTAVLIIMLGMVSYAAGTTVAAKKGEYGVGGADLLAVLGLWGLLFGLRPWVGHAELLLLIIALGVVWGWLVGSLRQRGQTGFAALPESELPEHAREKEATAVVTNPFKRAWQGWQAFSLRMGNTQGRLLMGFFYFLIVTPFGLGVRLFSDPLNSKNAPNQSNWQNKEAIDLTVESAREQG